MRHDITAYRYRFGSFIMVTMSPNEKFSAIMMRFHRVRESDPIHTRDAGETDGVGNWGGIHEPAFEESSEVELPIEDFVDLIPSSDARRRILARDPLACVQGFRTLALIVMRTLFGVNACFDCPSCNRHGESGCGNSFGSVATPTGGVLGVVEAVYGSIENQKAGALHVHWLLFLANMHQHLTLEEIADKIRATIQADGKSSIFEEYTRFKRHVDYEVYDDLHGFEARRSEIESRYPLLKDTAALFVLRAIAADDVCDEADIAEEFSSNMTASQHTEQTAEGEKWQASVVPLIQAKQEYVQHHIHPEEVPGDPDSRKPMPQCTSHHDRSKCKAHFPKKQARKESPNLREECAVVCEGLGPIMGIPTTGKPSFLGTMMGPINHNYLNGTHKAFLLCVPCNTDVSVHYRIPLTSETHSKMCTNSGCTNKDAMDKMTVMAQRQQHDSAGYVCDYCSKKFAVAASMAAKVEVGRRWLLLSERYHGASRGEQAVASTKQLLGHLHTSKCQYAVETVNLLAFRQKGDPTAAESIKSGTLDVLDCNQHVKMATQPNAEWASPHVKVDDRKSGGAVMKPRPRNAVFYAFRPSEHEMLFASAYEFCAYYIVVPVTMPTHAAQDMEHTHVVYTGTPRGSSHGDAGKHYVIRAESGITRGNKWFAFHPGAEEEHPSVRHDFVLERRVVPTVPRLPYAMPNGASKKAMAMRLCVYFRPWTAYTVEDIPQAAHLVATTAEMHETDAWEDEWADFVCEGDTYPSLTHATYSMFLTARASSCRIS
jgi:hypothetical protein